MLAYLVRKPDTGAFAIVAFSLSAGGAAGKLIDRILFDGGVTDFPNLGIGQVCTGICPGGNKKPAGGVSSSAAGAGIPSR